MSMFSLVFMRNAYLAGTFIAIICGTIGVFVIARNLSFLTHTLSEIGFAGAAFGIFMGWTALSGMLIFTVISSVIVGQMSVKQSRREASISAISALFIGLGILFLSLSNQTSSYATSILFGSVIGIASADVIRVAILSAIVLLVMLGLYRPLKFDSFDAIGARVSGLWTTGISVVFLVLVAMSVSVAAQIVLRHEFTSQFLHRCNRVYLLLCRAGLSATSGRKLVELFLFSCITLKVGSLQN